MPVNTNLESAAIITKYYKYAKKIHVIGAGAIGSQIIHELYKAGYPLELIHVYDFDVVEAHNLTSQIFSERHIGMLKTEAIVDHIMFCELSKENIIKYMSGDIIPFQKTPVIHGKYEDQDLDGYVIIAVDSYDTRIKILTNCQLSYKIDFVYSAAFPNIGNLSDLFVNFVCVDGGNYSQFSTLIGNLEQAKKDTEESAHIYEEVKALQKICRTPNFGFLGGFTSSILFTMFLFNLEIDYENKENNTKEPLIILNTFISLNELLHA